jgi:AbrB family looped-hinge helix DNA binding protein
MKKQGARQKAGAAEPQGLMEAAEDSLLPSVTTTVSSKGQIVLPAEIRLQDDVKPGQQFEIERIERGEYRLKRKTPPCNKVWTDKFAPDISPTLA